MRISHVHVRHAIIGYSSDRNMTIRVTVQAGLRSSAALVVMAILANCSSLGSLGRTIVESGITPTSDIRGSQTGRPGEFLPVGVRPPSPGPQLSLAERQTVEQELLAARARVKTLAASPVDRPLPPPPAPPPAPIPPKKPDVPADFQNRIY